MFSKKAAMFGLDARIALAIFGALSVISGAALYSAIQNAKVVQYHQFFNELVKATEQYYLDNGKQLPFKGSYTIHAFDLVENRESLSTWNGAYIDTVNETGTSDFRPKEGILGAGFYSSMAVYKQSSGAGSVCVVGSLDCAEYFVMNSDASSVDLLKNIFNLLDEYVDGGDGMLDGKVRYRESTATVHYFYYQGLTRKRLTS